jgi:glycosyltransferase involved in cell wall biosynthesis
MEKAKVSIIIPAYNAEDYIDRCLYSVRNQSYSNFEIIVVDDGSTDDTFRLIRKHQRIDPRVRLVRHLDHLGPNQSRNEALDMVTGELVMFICSDDYYTRQGAISSAVLYHRDSDFLLFGTKKTAYYYHEEKIKKAIFMLSVYGKLDKACGKLYRMDIIRRHQLAFDESVTVGGECLFNVAYASHCRHIRTIKEPFHRHVWNSRAAIRQLSPEDSFSDLATSINKAAKLLRDIDREYFRGMINFSIIRILVYEVENVTYYKQLPQADKRKFLNSIRSQCGHLDLKQGTLSMRFYGLLYNSMGAQFLVSLARLARLHGFNKLRLQYDFGAF